MLHEPWPFGHGFLACSSQAGQEEQGVNYLALEPLVDLVKNTDEFSQLAGGIQRGYNEQLVVGAAGSYKPALIAGLFGRVRAEKKSIVVVTYSSVQAERLWQELSSLVGDEFVQLFPANEVYPQEEVTRNLDLAKERLTVLTEALNSSGHIIVAPVQAVMERILSPNVYAKYVLSIDMDTRIEPAVLADRLVAMGYSRVEIVEGPAQFSIRGAIIDIFPLVADQPYRIELFDDEVDSIRYFDIDSQRSTDKVERIVVAPATELLVDPVKKEETIAFLHKQLEMQLERLERLKQMEAADALEQRISFHIEKLQAGMYFPGMEQYRPILLSELGLLTDYFPGALLVLDEPVRVREQQEATEQDFGEMISSLLERGRVLPLVKENYVGWSDLLGQFKTHQLVYLSTLATRAQGMNPRQIINSSVRTPQNFHGKSEVLKEQLDLWHQEEYRVVMTVSSENRARRLVEILQEMGLTVIFAPELGDEVKPGNMVVTLGNLQTGFELIDDKLVVLSDAEIYGRRPRQRRRSSVEEGVRITKYEDLKPGDYVVHINHGIGRYIGVQTLEVAGVHKDYLALQYAGDDKLYVPTDQVGLLQKYIGVEGNEPKLYKLGGTDWARVKKKVKDSVQDIAKGLLKLYAEREAEPGFAFSPDTVWQREFEESFPYQETEDQLRAIDEIKKDMESPRPMDRLLCGDVGYGKTEVAIRAAFKAIMDGKQVAVLVPTTILAQQHHRTFVERFDGTGANIGVISRFQSAAEQRNTLQLLARGQLDIVIGTHRLLSKDVKFKNLGLLIVDEEQRFGVVQKERLKEIAKGVDVLTLTATPIPRTLHMALVGVRDMSVIETPPENRFPVRTYVIEYEDEVIREAILRELAREGQVYFVYNRVRTIDAMAQHLMSLVPEARIAVAHGQMDENRLERIMMDFLQQEYDILLCTTIIETGMDIPNVNTLIVYDADHMGLAQLYQLRGRVGRTNRVAYAYFTYRRDKILSEDAEKRLQAIREFTELGSGFKIAMRDLEIRGAGNLLGPEQHGFIASVGFELYCKLLEESIRELKGEVQQELPEPVLDLEIDAYLPDDYIPSSQQKVEMYRKFMAVRDAQDAEDLTEELEDRFGDLPLPVRHLLAVTQLKNTAKRCGVASINRERDFFVVKLHSGLEPPSKALDYLGRQYRGRLTIAKGRQVQIRLRIRGLSDSEALGFLDSVLMDLMQNM